jgi:hypothetical protein
MSRNSWIVPLLLASSLVLGEETPPAKPDEPAAPTAAAPEAQAKKDEGPKTLDGMSILGNQEAPKALVIVPWKSSELGSSLGIAPMLGDSREPVDKEVFLRALSYYEIRSGTTHSGKSLEIKEQS